MGEYGGMGGGMLKECKWRTGGGSVSEGTE